MQRAYRFTTSNDEKSKNPAEDDRNAIALKKGDDDVKTIKERLMNDCETKKHAAMAKVGIPLSSVLHEMKVEKVTRVKIQNFQCAFEITKSNHKESEETVKDDISSTTTIKERDVKLIKEELINNSESRKYAMMTKVGAPLPSVLHKMKMEKVPEDDLQLFERVFGLSILNNKESVQSVEGKEKEKNYDVKS